MSESRQPRHAPAVSHVGHIGHDFVAVLAKNFLIEILGYLKEIATFAGIEHVPVLVAAHFFIYVFGHPVVNVSRRIASEREKKIVYRRLECYHFIELQVVTGIAVELKGECPENLLEEGVDGADVELRIVEQYVGQSD